ncbi:hypothetical protein O6P37_01745 [Mycobacterium sp. CPCC 205372]|uniref:Uncharacterized protein n=1 Tax=Mycobacterium hippophais TaxID=3016340 RepID=A0ABT4PLY0_9MYCO|nr:hypothetical protein [Mycobacterium hippophais]MCZ8377578.1 hypothetical protein [Mycobacterium hippophais]
MSPQPLPFDHDDASDLPIFIREWRDTVDRQLQRLDEGHASDANLLIVAAHQLQLACRAYAVDDSKGDLTRLVDDFAATHPHLPELRNFIVHFDEYYRGQGRHPQARGRRVFRYSYGRSAGEWELAFGLYPESHCRVDALGRDAVAMADQVLALPPDIDGWINRMMRRRR